jgi:hypothetical protein
MSKEQQELLDKAYNKYQSQTWFHIDDLSSLAELDGMNMSTGERKKVYRQYAPVEFIDKCKTNPEFSEKWGLKIEERELSAKERWDWYRKNGGPSGEQKLVALMVYEDEEDNSHIHSWLKTWAPNIPTKLITITYNDKTIESYE